MVNDSIKNSQMKAAKEINGKQVIYSNEYGIWISEDSYREIKSLLEAAKQNVGVNSFENQDEQLCKKRLTEIASYVKNKKSLTVILKYIYHIGSSNLMRSKHFKGKSFMEIIDMYEQGEVNYSELLEALKECIGRLKRYER